VATTANVFAQIWHRGAEQAARDLGIENAFILQESPDGTGDLQQAISNVQISYLRGADMVTGYLSGGYALPGVAKAAADNGMTLAYAWNERPWFTPVDANKSWVNFLTPDNFDVGRLIAKSLFEAMEGEGGFVAIIGAPGTGSSERRTIGMQQAMKETPGVKLLGQQIGNYNRTDSREAMDQLLTAHPDFKGVWAANDDTAIGAISALEDRGKTDVRVCGTDATQEALNMIKDGSYTASFSPHAPWMSGFCVVNAFDAIHGWEPSVPERMLYSEGLVVTKDNVDAYYELLYGSDELPVDYRKMSRTLNPQDWDTQVPLRPIHPEQLWSYTPKPPGYNLPKEYAEARANGQFEEVKRTYAEHYKTNAFKV
jgi:ribose transport system substrate-binding protein